VDVIAGSPPIDATGSGAEAAWRNAAAIAPALDLPARAVVVVPHPDDECLATGALVAALAEAGIPLSIVAVTDGEAAYAGVDDLAARRRGEQRRAVRCLGVEPGTVIRLGLPDSAVDHHRRELVAALAPLCDERTTVVAPWLEDWHPDHEACGRAARDVAGATGARLLGSLFWAYHFRRPVPELVGFPVTSELRARRREAVEAHRSQRRPQGHRPIVADEHLWPLDLPAELYVDGRGPTGFAAFEGG
jgi:LmbE family N-acetylglucosaminyl deacetylase